MVYQLSNEHHVRTEDSNWTAWENWDINAPQTEGGSRESIEGSGPLEIQLIEEHHHCQLSRLSGGLVRVRPSPAAISYLQNPENIRFRNIHVNAESGSSDSATRTDAIHSCV